MIYIISFKKLHHFFEDYINSIIKKININLLIEDRKDIITKMINIAEKDKDYKFIIVPALPRFMNKCKLNKFNKNSVYILNTEQLSRNRKLKEIMNFQNMGYNRAEQLFFLLKGK